jgi:hypothetical protein
MSGQPANLFKAVMSDDPTLIEAALAAGARVNAANGAGITALELAFERGKVDGAAYLARRGADYLRAQLPKPFAPTHELHAPEGVGPNSLKLLELHLQFPELDAKSLRRLLSFSGDQLAAAVDSARGLEEDGVSQVGSTRYRRHFTPPSPECGLSGKVRLLWACFLRAARA